MPVNPNIALGIRPAEFVSPMQMLAQAQQIDAMGSQSELRMAQLATLKREAEDTAMYRTIMRDNPDADAPTQAKLLRRAGLVTQADTLEKNANDRVRSGLEVTKAQGDIGAQQTAARRAEIEAGLQRFQVIGQVMSGVRDQATYDQARQQLASTFGPQMAEQMPPQYDPQRIAQARAQAMDVKAQMENEWKGLQHGVSQQNANSASRQADAAMVAAGQVPVQYVATDQGILPMPSRLPNPGAGPAAPLAAPSPAGQPGQPVAPAAAPTATAQASGVPALGRSIGGKPLENAPETVLKAARENNAAVRKIDDALAAIDLAPGAIGPTNMIPGATTVRGWAGSTADNRARALIADVGSLKIHDRSGAAVSVSEFPRLAPFVPSASDTPEQARIKLREFSREYKAVQAEIAAEYTPSRGFKPSPTLGTDPSVPPSAGLGADPKDPLGIRSKIRGSSGGR